MHNQTKLVSNLKIRVLEHFNFIKTPNGKNILKNIGWLILDKLIKLSSGLFLGVLIARYLGPNNFGLLNYATAFAGLMGALISLGLDSIVIKELVKEPEKAHLILGSSFALKLAASIIGVILNLIIIWLLNPENNVTIFLVVVSSMGYIFQSINVIDYYFQSKTQLKYTLIAQNLAFFIILIFRIYLLISKSSVVSFAIATLIENAISSLFLIFLFKKYAGFSIFNWKFSKKISKKLLIESFPLMLASIASTINMRVDQVMLGTMLNKKEVGIFAAAVRISEIWFLVPAFLGMTIYPSIILARERDYSEYRKKVHKIVFIMSTIVFPFALIVTFFSEFIVKLLYGESFVGASQILSIHIWSGVPYVAAFAYGQVFYAESLTKLTSYTAFYTVAVNLTLNYFLIPRFGAVGAAYTSMISAISAFVLSMVLLNKHSKIFSTKLDFNYEKK